MITSQVKRIHELSEGIKRKRQEDDAQHFWNSSRNNVNKILEEVSTLMRCEEWLEDIDPSYVKTPIRGVTAASGAIKTLLEAAESGDARKTNEQLVKVEERCRATLQSQKESTAKGWKKLKDDVAWGNSHIYAAFKGHETHGIHFEELVQAEQIFRQQLEPQPYLSQKEDQELFEHVLNIRNQLLKKLPKMDNLEVEEFLKNAANDGAKLGSLTDNVKDWLRNNKLGAKYVIKQR